MTLKGILIPLGLGLAAGVVNFMVIRGATAPLDFVALKEDVKPGTELTFSMLEKVSVRGDRQLLLSAVPWSERSILERVRIGRPIKAHELVLFTDARPDHADDVQANLRAGETDYPVPVRIGRISPGLKMGDEVGFMILGESKGVPRSVGPFRFLGFGERNDPFQTAALGRLEMRKVVIAVPIQPSGQMGENLKVLNEAIQAGGTDEKNERIQSVGHFKQ